MSHGFHQWSAFGSGFAAMPRLQTSLCPCYQPGFQTVHGLRGKIKIGGPGGCPGNELDSELKVQRSVRTADDVDG